MNSIIPSSAIALSPAFSLFVVSSTYVNNSMANALIVIINTTMLASPAELVT